MFGFGEKSNLNSDDMDDLRRQGINVDGNNDPAPNNILDEVSHTGDGHSWISEEIICLRRSEFFHNTYVDFKNIFVRR